MKRIATQLLLVLFALSILLPVAWVLISSLKSGPEILSTPWGLPASPQWKNYAEAWAEAGMSRNFMNSVVVTLCTLLILIPMSAMAAYVFARYAFRGARILFGAFLGGMMFPNILVIVPVVFLLQSMHDWLVALHLVGSDGRLLGLMSFELVGLVIVYVAYSLSFSIFVLAGFFEAIPTALSEAARIDGCGHVRTFWSVMVPLAKPGILIVTIFNAIGLWNEYNLAFVLITRDENKTLPIGIASLTMTQHYQSNWGALFAALVIVMLPMMIVYWIFREKIYETMLAGALKG